MQNGVSQQSNSKQYHNSNSSNNVVVTSQSPIMMPHQQSNAAGRYIAGSPSMRSQNFKIQPQGTASGPNNTRRMPSSPHVGMSNMPPGINGDGIPTSARADGVPFHHHMVPVFTRSATYDTPSPRGTGQPQRTPLLAHSVSHASGGTHDPNFHYAHISRQQPLLGNSHSAHPHSPSMQHQPPPSNCRSPINSARSPSGRQMRVSYVEPTTSWEPTRQQQQLAQQARVIGNISSRPLEYQEAALISLSRVSNPNSSTKLEGGHNSKDSGCLPMLCPGCRMRSIVTLVSELLLLVMIVLQCFHFFDQSLTFEYMLEKGAILGLPLLQGKEYYRILTSLFIHPSWLLLVVNIAFQQQVGNILGTR
eukprot:Lankesteria_metandrocarpae@DN146_c0_g1_i1.p1